MPTHKLTGATFILVNSDGKMLLQHRDEHAKRYPLMWCFPGGTIEEGEDSISAAIREIEEEYALCVSKEDCHFLTSHELSYGNSADVFVCKIGDQKPIMREGKDMKFVTINEVKELELGFEQDRLLTKIARYFEDMQSNQKIT